MRDREVVAPKEGVASATTEGALTGSGSLLMTEEEDDEDEAARGGEPEEDAEAMPGASSEAGGCGLLTLGRLTGSGESAYASNLRFDELAVGMGAGAGEGLRDAGGDGGSSGARGAGMFPMICGEAAESPRVSATEQRINVAPSEY